MTSLSNKPLFNQFISSLVFFLLVVVILDFVCSSTASVSSVTSPFVHTNNKVKVAEERKEAKTLLKWKTNLHSKSQSFLSSWAGSNPCNWVGINCDKSGSITHLNLSSHSLKGTLHNLSFQSFPNLLSVDLSYNSLFGTIPTNIVHLSKLSVLNLSYNQFTRIIPSEIGQLTSLHTFYLAANHMSGLIPPELGGLTPLRELDLSSNNLIVLTHLIELHSLAPLDTLLQNMLTQWKCIGSTACAAYWASCGQGGFSGKDSIGMLAHQSTFSSDHATSLSKAINLEIPVHKAFVHDHIKRARWSRKLELLALSLNLYSTVVPNANLVLQEHHLQPVQASISRPLHSTVVPNANLVLQEHHLQPVQASISRPIQAQLSASSLRED
nr:mdis1-interacting receptor like kinase 2 [Quercus suber]